MNTKAILAIVISVCTIITFLYKFDQHYAKASDVQLIAQSLDEINKSIQITTKQQRIDALQQPYLQKDSAGNLVPVGVPVSVQLVIDQLQEEINRLAGLGT